MIYFVRHGATDWNEHLNAQGIREPKCQGKADIELNQKGIEQAKQTAEELKDINFDRVICSPLKRAIHTCQLICPGDTPIEIDDRVVERDFGEFEGKTRTEFEFFDFWNDNCKKTYQKAEPLDELKKRVFDLLNELKQKPNQNVLIVSHGGVGCIICSYFYGVPESGNYLEFEIPNGKPLILDFEKIKQ